MKKLLTISLISMMATFGAFTANAQDDRHDDDRHDAKAKDIAKDQPKHVETLCGMPKVQLRKPTALSDMDIPGTILPFLQTLGLKHIHADLIIQFQDNLSADIINQLQAKITEKFGQDSSGATGSQAKVTPKAIYLNLNVDITDGGERFYAAMSELGQTTINYNGMQLPMCAVVRASAGMGEGEGVEGKNFGSTTRLTSDCSIGQILPIMYAQRGEAVMVEERP